MADILVANTTFVYVDGDGVRHWVPKGKRFREGHPVTVGRDELFDEDQVVEVEDAPESSSLPVKRPPGRPRKE